ncbi:MAG: hypothetical protein KGK07_16980, partial [Chloroflexota bacterium]|nr:hypothetical protein [Chloroflexota bacterium]
DGRLQPELREHAVARLREVLLAWEGTPYLPGQCARQRGVDCVRFVAGVYADLRGVPAAALPRLPQDLSFHAPGRALAAAALMRRACAPLARVRDGIVQPGDALVVARQTGAPGHAMLAGFDPYTLWHAPGPGGRVEWTGLDLGRAAVLAVYRPTDQLAW